MAQQPTWRGHRAPVEDPDGTPAAPTARRSRWPLLVGIAFGLAAVAGGVLLAGSLVGQQSTALPQIIRGTCLASADLASGSSSLRELDTVACGKTHDAEVFALRTLGVEEDLDRVSERCLAAAEELGVGLSQLTARDLEVRPLALTDSAPTAGDSVACFVRHNGGAPLRGAVFSPGSDQ